MSKISKILFEISDSTDIDVIGYDTNKEELIISFKKSTYKYKKVPFNVVLGFATTDSIGSYFNHEIKKKNFEYEKVELFTSYESYL